MRASLTCPACGHDRLWNVRTMRERGAHNLPQEMAVAFAVDARPADWHIRRPSFDAYGRFETLLCERCGHTEWYARDFQPDPRAAGREVDGGKNGPRVCVECEQQRFWFIPRMAERDENGDPVDLRVVRKGFPKPWWEGSFSTFVCRSCGWTAWYAQELSALEVDLSSGVGLLDRKAPCRDCGGTSRWHVDTMHETGDAYVTALHVVMRMTFWYARTVGKFATEICRGCGLTHWRAREYETLRHDPRHGVALLERTQLASAGGPYR